MSEREHQVHEGGGWSALGSRRTLGLIVAATFGLTTPALAETAGGSLGVTAIVLPSCLVSTAGAGDAAPASVSCSNFGEGSVAIEQDQARTDSPRAPDRPEAPASEDSTKSSDVTYVTISY